ncbi:hypothetical protein EMPS_05551 [Entomortierella parvispora]|uniref:Mediator of RNA polymerase II transcription subunit 9 n=1 Tax=Entomortierella parvispora TaxID=205924 RepID=A0A9P3LWL3_9FUNG|nr:hypothetical protein EMPS_05551 [Entomortierella parvispora]
MSMPTIAQNSGDTQQEQTFQPSDFSFLSQLLHIIQRVESGEDAQEIAALASNLKTSFKKCQMILDHLPGADLSPDEQDRILAEELEVLERKKAQLASYLAGGVFSHATEENSSNEQRIPHALKASVKDEEETSATATDLAIGLSEGEMRGGMAGEKGVLEQSTTEQSMPSLVADESFMLSSQGSAIAPGELSTGLSLDLSDIKMGDSTEGGAHDPQ